jgi:hypothetical protein
VISLGSFLSAGEDKDEDDDKIIDVSSGKDASVSPPPLPLNLPRLG